MKKSELLFGLILVPLDIAALSLGFYLSYAIRAELHPLFRDTPIVEYMQLIWYLTPVWILIFALSGLYTLRSTRELSKDIGRLFVATAAGTAVVVGIGYLFPNPYLNLNLPDPLFPAKAIPLLGFVFTFLIVSLFRWIVIAVQKSLLKYGIGVHRVLVIGDNELSRTFRQAVAENPALGFLIAGVISENEIPILRKHIQETGVDELLLSTTHLSMNAMLSVVQTANAHHVQLRFIPSVFGLVASRMVVSEVAGLPLVEVKRTPLEGWGQILKRAFDVATAAAVLMVLLPFFVLIAIAVRLDSPGPVFFLHRRLGRDGKPFFIFKFRTMIRDAENILAQALNDAAFKNNWENSYKMKNDPRVTRVGRFLRKTSLDELPQLFNVLLGEMSLVGPRPIVPAEQAKYEHFGDTLLVIKPGITGLWQASGRSDLSYDERVRLDLYYIENWSLWLDISILMKTALRVLRREGAY